MASKNNHALLQYSALLLVRKSDHTKMIIAINLW